MEHPVLEMNHISKSFAGIPVLKSVTLEARQGEVHALVGENGAGKSTLMKILMGIHSADGGEVRVHGRKVIFRNPGQAIACGVSMIHQELNPVPDMDVSENLFLGREIRQGKLGGRILVDRQEQRRRTAELLQQFGLSISPRQWMRNLSVAEIQMIEILKAVSISSRVIIMDEPTSAITQWEAERLFRQIDRLREQGVAILYISHKMEEIFRIADRITVLRDGNRIGTFPKSEINRETLIRKMVGREIGEFLPKVEVPIGEVVLEVRNLSRHGHFDNVSFRLHAGEILGIGGLMGAGRSELAECIFGMTRPTSGEIFIRNRRVCLRHPKEAIRNRMALLTEDRKETGLNLKGTVQENLTLAGIARLARFGLIDNRRESQVADQTILDMKIKAGSRQMPVAALSGGNQQKVVLCKWLYTDPEIILLDEPTRGIDVASKMDIYLLMGELVKAGKALILISSELPELMGLSDRILVLSEGKLAGEMHRSQFSAEAILRYASSSRGDHT